MTTNTNNSVELRILIKDRPITNYYHNGKYFVEGRAGSNFELEVINKNPHKIEAILSVDGLSITDGKSAGQHSVGYLVEANSSIKIPGWKISDEKVASFEFTGKENSYSTGQTGSSVNNGVIGLMAFKDKNYRPVMAFTARPQILRSGISKSPSDIGDWLSGPIATCSVYGSSASDTSYNPMSMSEDYFFSASANGKKRGTKMKSLPSAQDQYQDIVAMNNLGTGFGTSKEFETKSVAFERGDLLAMSVIYYDNAKGLKARGIDVGRKSKTKHTAIEPQAFPTMNCPIPPNWKG